MKHYNKLFLLMSFLMIAIISAGAQEQSLQNALNMGAANTIEPLLQTSQSGSQTWDSQFAGSSGANGAVRVVVVSGNDVFVGGEFTSIGGISANYIARYSLATNTWSSLGTGGNNGTSASVRAIAVNFNDVYVGGTFTTAGNLPSASYVARFNLQSNTWSALASTNGEGVNNFVNAISVLNGVVYIGGTFNRANNSANIGTTIIANHIARFNTANNTWLTLGRNDAFSGVNGAVNAIAILSGEIYLGGSFTTAASASVTSITANRIVRYAPATNSFSSVGAGTGNGVNNSVFAITVSGSDLFFGGNFGVANVGGTTVTANGVVRFSGGSWSSVGTGSANGVSGTVFGLTVSGSALYVGGNFTVAGGNTANRVAFYDYRTATWSAVISGVGNGVDNTVRALAAVGSDVWVGGDFGNANVSGTLVPSSFIGRWFGAPFPNAFATVFVNTGTTNVTFPGTGVTIRFFVASTSGNVTVERYDNAPIRNVTFSDSATQRTTPFRFVITGAISTISAELRFNTGQIPNFNTFDPSTVRVFTRPTVGTGAFSILPNIYNPTQNPNEVRGGISGSLPAVSEVILGTDDISNPFGFATYLQFATNISSNSATLHGFINPNGIPLSQVRFQYSPDSTFNTGVQNVDVSPNPSLITGFSPIGVSASIPIQQNQIVYYRLSVTDNSSVTTITNRSSVASLTPPFPSNNLALWLRSDLLVTQFGNRISNWGDLSGLNRNAISSRGERPSIIQNSAGFGNKAVVSFADDGTSSFGFRRIPDIRTLFIVARSSDANNLQFLLGDSTSFQFQGGVTTLFDATSSSLNVRNGDLFFNSVSVPTSANRPTSSTIISLQTAGNVPASTLSRDRNFTTRSWRGEIAEVIIYNRVLSAAERVLVENYLSQRYNLGVQSTISNPTISANQGGTFVLGSTGVTVTFTTASTTAGSLSGSVTNSRPTVVGQLPTGIVNLAERFWTINQSGLTGFTCALTFDLSTLGGVQNFNNLKVLRRNNASSPWVDVETLSGVSITRNAPFITVAGITSFSDFTIGSDASNQLPVELTEFTGRKSEQGVELAWRTASELNNSGFEVERKSQGADWNTLGFVLGNGTTTEAQSYSFLDKSASGKVQYRLKQIDFDGQFEYSNVIEVDAGLPKAFALEQNYPNPFNPTTVISYQLPVAGNISLKIYDVLGKEVMTLVNGRQEAGAYNFTLNAASLASGIYFYRLQSGNFVQTKKMMLVK
jgi:hypothetical protein